MGASLGDYNANSRHQQEFTRPAIAIAVCWGAIILLLAAYVLVIADLMPWNATHSTPAPTTLTCPAGTDTITFESGGIAFCDG